MANFHSLTVSNIKRETPSSVVLTLAVPGNLMKEFQFKAGQYVTFKHTIDGKEVRRAYSLCSAPHENKLRVAVKEVDGGTFSVFANKTLKENDALEVMIPEGKFTLVPEKNTTNNYAAFVAGSGITPVISIIKTVLEDEPNSRFLLAYGNQSLKETMFYEDLMELKRQNGDRLQLEFVYSRTKENEGRAGRIDRDLVNHLLTTKFEYTTFDDFYLCGPEPMIDEVRSTLKEQGINEKIVHFELFTTAEEGLLIEEHDGSTEITLTIDDETETFTMDQADSILDAALAKKLDAPYSCQGGICSTCIARVVEGKAEMRKNQILTDGEIADGLILTCQAHPTTAKLVVDYDDV